MKHGRRATKRIDIGSIRRGQIIEAAIAVIAEKGLQELSLSKIESKVGMSRGQLTYYFKTKEAILLAVFNRLLEIMGQEHGGGKGEKWPVRGTWSELVEQLLGMILQNPPHNPAFSCLQYTFLSQIGHRKDYRRSLARLYEEWRHSMAKHLELELTRKPAARAIKPRVFATLVQAILHGLAVQNAADPNAIDRQAVITLCMDMLRTYLWNGRRVNGNRRTIPANRNGVSHERIRI